MGKYNTGAWTVYESLHIELPFLLKRGLVKKGCTISFNLDWTDQRGNPSGSITCCSTYLSELQNQYLQVSYGITNIKDGKETDHQYKIYFTEKDSNLGKGKVLYFLCPESGKRCRILYKAYGSHIFKCRESYQHRLYYDCQHSSKLYKYVDNYWRIEKQLAVLQKEACRGRRTYNGVPTKKAERYNRLFEKQSVMDELRWTAGVPKSLRKFMVDGRLPI